MVGIAASARPVQPVLGRTAKPQETHLRSEAGHKTVPYAGREEAGRKEPTGANVFQLGNTLFQPGNVGNEVDAPAAAKFRRHAICNSSLLDHSGCRS
jgi:hypothetical protein